MSRFSYKSLILILLFLLIPIVLFLRISQRGKEVSAEWFNDSWNYRQRVDIDNSSGSELTDFQVSIDIGTSALIAAGKMQSDCDDIRITDQNGNLLPYWIETNGLYACNQSATKIWVKAPSIPTSGAPVYLYYGNSSATSSQNGNNVFEFFDDFNGSSIDTSKWTQGTTNPTSGTEFSVSGGNLNGGNQNRYIQSVATFTGDYVTETRTYTTTPNINGFSTIGFWESTTNSFGILDHNNSSYYRNDSSWVGFSFNGTSQWTRNIVKAVGTSATYSRIGETSGSINGTATNSGVNNEYIRLGSRFDNSNLDQNYVATWDWVLVRKAVNSQPTATPATEEVGGGPIAHWKFDEGVGTTAYDSTSNSRDGLITSATWQKEESCISGNCLFFSGTSNSSIQTTAVNPSLQMTISVWIKRTDNTADGMWHPIVSSGGNLNNGTGWFLTYRPSWDNLRFYIGDGTYDYAEANISNFPVDKWLYVTATVTDTNIYLYVDGKQISAPGHSTTNMVYDSSPLKIGTLCYCGCGDHTFQGFIDEVKIFPYARTESQIKADYASGLAGMSSYSDSSVNIGGASSGKSLSDGLVGYWKMDEASGNFSDYSGNNNTGVVSGSSNYDSGKFGNSFRAGTAITNMITNPSVETNMTSWNYQYVSQGSAAISNDRSVFGTYSLKITRTVAGSESNVYNNVAGLSNSTQYYFSTWAWSSTPNTACVFSYNATSNVPLVCHSGSSQWERIGGAFTTTTAGVVQLRLSHSSSELSSVYFDGMQVELGSSLSSYIDGSLGAGYAWTSTPHASTSTRTASSATVANSTSLDITSKTITLNTWVKPTTYPLTYSVIFQKAGYTSGYRLMLNSTGKIYAGIGETGGGVLTSTSSIPLNSWTQVSMTYDGQNIKIFFNGVLDSYTPYTNNLITSSNGIVFGSTEYPFLHGFVDEVRIYNRALSPTEVKKLYEFAPGPVAYYNFEEGVGTTAYDSSGNNIHTTWLGSLGSQWTIGKYGTAGNFNGTDTYLTKTDQDAIDIKTGSSTWSLWFKTNQSTRGIMYRKSDASNTNGVLIDIGVSVAGQIKCAVHYSPSITITSLTSTYNDNKWHHLTCTLDRNDNTLKMYIDGKIGATTLDASTLSAIDLNATSNVYIGQGSGGFFNGQIDDIKIYNYARTQKQIIEDMNAGASATSARGGPLVHYKFNEGQGSSITNWGFGGTSLNANLGTSTSAPSWNNNGKFGKALFFSSSSNQYVYTTDGITNGPLDVGQPELTLTAWINPSTLSGTQAIINKNGPYLLWIDGANKRLYTGLYTGTWYWLYSENNSLTTNSWQHVAMTYDGTTRKLYINGKRSGNNDTQVSGSLTTVNSDVQIGRDTAVGGRFYFDGLIDEIKIYNYALSADEVKQDYNQGSTFVFGQSNQTIGATTTSLDYCIPGDTSPCSPPIAEWKFEEGVGTTAYDTSGNNNHGIFGTGSSAPSWTTGKIGTALSFNGTSNVIDIPDQTFTGPFTYSFWLKNNDNSGTRMWSSGSGSQKFGTVGEKFFVRVISSSDNTINLPTQNTWHHITLTRDSGDKVDLYLDGILHGRLFSDAAQSGTTYLSILGQANDGSGQFFSGQMDQVRIYNYARTPAQIAWSYNKGAPVGHWKMDECQGTQIADWSGNVNHGTLSIGASGTQTSPGTCPATAGAWANGKLGKLNSSLNFDGSDDYVTVTNADSLKFGTNDFTISFWTYRTAIGANNGTYLNKGVYTQGFDCYDNIFRVNTSTGELARVGLNATLNTWQLHTFVITQNSTPYIKHYINGVFNNTGYSAAGNLGSFNSDNYNFRIGYGTAGGVARYFTGQIDDVRIYNYALTPTQIKTLYNNGAVTFR